MTVIDDALTQAQVAVVDLPDEYRSEAFGVVLRYLLFAGDQSEVRPANPENDLSSDLPEQPVCSTISSSSLPEPKSIKRGTRTQQIAWAAVLIEERGADSVTTQTIRNAIRVELGLTPPAATNTAAIMQELVPEYFRRVREGRGYAYHATENVLKLFEGLDS